MSDNTPERLKEFRAEYAGTTRSSNRLALVQIGILLVGFGAVFGFLATIRQSQGPSRNGAFPGGGLSAETLRDYAGYLAQKKLPRAAIEAYEAYLDRAALNNVPRAKVCYSVAKLAIEADEFETALAYLYQAELLDPESDLKDEIDKKVALCLDKLGRPVELRRELRKRTDLTRKASDIDAEETVLAEFAGQVITDRDLELEIERLPAAVRETLDAPEKKAELLKNIVAERLLLDKARLLELDKDPEIQERLAAQLDAMIVRKLIEDEIRSKISITPEDVERFYKAETARFSEPAKARVRVAKAETAEAAKAVTEFPDETVEVWAGRRVPGIPGSEEAVEIILATEPGEVAGPVSVEEEWYVFQVVSKTAERVMPLEEVRSQATGMLEMQKEQEQLRALIEATLKARDVRLYPERLAEVGATP